LKEIVIEEAYRTIKVTEGKRQISIPMAKAVMRALAVNPARANCVRSRSSPSYSPKRNALTVQ
jgi:hypothetical protein